MMARTFTRLSIPAALGLALAAPALADDTIALSAQERAAVLDRAAAGDGDLPLNGQGRKIHGEMGFEIGTRGTRALFGTTVVPLGETGSVALSFLTAQQNRGRR